MVLRLPNNELPSKVQTDVSQFGIGVVLLQTYTEDDRPVYYVSKKLTATQQRWPPIVKKMLCDCESHRTMAPLFTGSAFHLRV